MKRRSDDSQLSAQNTFWMALRASLAIVCCVVAADLSEQLQDGPNNEMLVVAMAPLERMPASLISNNQPEAARNKLISQCLAMQSAPVLSKSGTPYTLANVQRLSGH